MNQPFNPSDRSDGFSLLELLAVVTILGILASIIVPRVTVSTANAKEKTCFHHRGQINAAVETFAFKNGALPNDLSDLDTPDVFPDGIPVCPVSEIPYTLDPTTKRVFGHLGGGKFGGHPF